MKIIFPILVLAIWPSLGLGQSDEQVLRSSSPSGLKINEDAMIPAGRDGAVSNSASYGSNEGVTSCQSSWFINNHLNSILESL